MTSPSSFLFPFLILFLIALLFFKKKGEYGATGVFLNTHDFLVLSVIFMKASDS